MTVTIDPYCVFSFLLKAIEYCA
ncbi:hypothetical protein EYZ11_012263 [Aspergillus tanneri]|uniref:Uncharacterized protein n=1 Tax=Aspergillus tanneri TaxID=1220188 RepID=A0A4S3J629_9EURO|nr:hypothetical protein EYZ11_012263 [Aspergillus tanneri]